ncbi:hypothetical protein KQH49_06780 [Mycetohabitans sp. B5]|uniref:Uncharacterized protein n=1 Tax=Mycetohabitans endofungorum TaxID=417203 RepID=A0A2P5KA58_9BURK|nr:MULTISPECIES: hypothetical protein [Burkholderiaceae]MCG1038789.1 hypothetical protein [Mycetohabitans sp. B7]MCG1054674.1 hypothetical protein [Mycetohabitans sp. B5]PPB83582.1 hypothetical protein B0O95_10798 [Mycetohabitans endofungorum]SIT68918.1 hypothetical protein SAMN04487769_1408 [Burkholderia sp. b14]
MHYVYSTATCDTAYGVWINSGNDLPIRTRAIVIKGGAGVANKNLITPRGVVTQVTDEDLALLEKDEAFQRHVKRGFIHVERSKTDPEKVAADMTGRDQASPLVPQDFAEKKRPKTRGE